MTGTIRRECQQIGYDLKQIRQQWRDEALLDYNAAIGRDLAVISEVEREAWAAWEGSKGGDGLGDPRYLSAVGSCIERRIKLLGLDGPEVVDWHWLEAQAVSISRASGMPVEAIMVEARGWLEPPARGDPAAGRCSVAFTMSSARGPTGASSKSDR